MLFNCLHEGRKYIARTCVFLVCGLIVLAPNTSLLRGEELSLSLTIAPPLFQLSLQPGETWSSGVTVVNNNPYDVTLFAEPVPFEPSGESGKPVFISPHIQGDDAVGISSSTLAGWIQVPQQARTVSREQTYTLPVSIHVPEDASPGGHYAAILIGNRAPEGANTEGGTVNVTSSIAVLFFLSVSGDVIEQGRVRDFATEKSVYETPEATLTLRFENQGNVHLLPQGNITIYNMFGKVRGSIPVNNHKDYGNVFPNSIRKFSFTWKSDAGMWDIGRYRAEVTLGYGKEQKQSALATTYFYVLPIIPLLQVVGGLLALMYFVGWAIRAYVRRALALETAHVRTNETSVETEDKYRKGYEQVEVPRIKLGTLVQPIKAGFVDLRHVGAKPESVQPDVQAVYMPHHRQQTEALTFSTFLYKYWLFFLSVIVLALGGFALSFFLEDVMTVSRTYSVTEVRPDGSEVDLPVNKSTIDDIE